MAIAPYKSKFSEMASKKIKFLTQEEWEEVEGMYASAGELSAFLEELLTGASSIEDMIKSLREELGSSEEERTEDFPSRRL